jgi:hypothetical protein
MRGQIEEKNTMAKIHKGTTKLTDTNFTGAPLNPEIDPLRNVTLEDLEN